MHSINDRSCYCSCCGGGADNVEEEIDHQQTSSLIWTPDKTPAVALLFYIEKHHAFIKVGDLMWDRQQN